MPRNRDAIPLIVAGVLPLVALGVLFFLLMRPRPPMPDFIHAPRPLKEICLEGRIAWRAWSEIIIHHSAGKNGNLELIDRVHRKKRGWRCAGYHFVIGNGTLSGDGEIEVGPRWHDQETGAHCYGRNETAIGICLIGDFQKDAVKPTDVQLAALTQLTAYLSLRYDIPLERIRFHGEVSTGPTDCPGKNFPVETFRRELPDLILEYRGQ